MVCTCMVPGCSASTRKIHGVSFHRLPKELDLCKKWLRAINNPKFGEDTAIEALKHLTVCSLHFKPEDFEPNPLGVKRPALVKPAIPSIFTLPDDDGEQSGTSRASSAKCLETKATSTSAAAVLSPSSEEDESQLALAPMLSTPVKIPPSVQAQFMALIKQESEDIKIEEVFSMKHEETEEQTGAKPGTEQMHKVRGQTSKLHKWALLERFPVLLLARRGSSGFSAECFCPWKMDTEHTHEAFLTIQRLYESLLNVVNTDKSMLGKRPQATHSTHTQTETESTSQLTCNDREASIMGESSQTETQTSSSSESSSPSSSVTPPPVFISSPPSSSLASPLPQAERSTEGPVSSSWGKRPVKRKADPKECPIMHEHSAGSPTHTSRGQDSGRLCSVWRSSDV